MGIYCKKASFIVLCFLFSVFITTVSGQNMFRKMMDFDGDGKADFAITRDVGGARYWYIWQTTNGYTVVPWGISTDQNAPGDYDHDGKFDPAIYRSILLTGGSRRYQFWILGSEFGSRVGDRTTNDYPNSVAYQQDYDGNGTTDISWTIEDNARYFILFSGGASIAFNNPGGTFIKVGDVTGDGKADGAAFNTNTGMVSIRNSDTGTVQTIQFGLAGDQFMPADFDGDGIGDLAIFRPSNGQWWWIRSSDNAINAATFGTSGDVPVPADYDGDGKTDIAIWRPGAQSQYWVYGSQVGIFVFNWGISGDTVVHY
jgi:hypothetical protein